jgi:hypothetical protein
LIVVIGLGISGEARGNDFGLGVIIGEPTGISAKAWLSHKSALDFALAWSFEEHARFHVHGDYLLHSYNLIVIDSVAIPVYYGIGGRLVLRDEDHDDLLGVRIPFGIEYLPADVPIDVFFELVPILNLTPDTDIRFNGAVGIRYLF